MYIFLNLYYYGVCNQDVLFTLDYLGNDYYREPTQEPVDKSKNISLSFYDYDTYKRFIRDTQDGNTTYKNFLGKSDLNASLCTENSTIHGIILSFNPMLLSVSSTIIFVLITLSSP